LFWNVVENLLASNPFLAPGRLIRRSKRALLNEHRRIVQQKSKKYKIATERRPTMKDFAASIKRFLASEDGPTAVEYAVMLALIIVVCLTAVKAVGTNANNKFTAVKNALT
jgi:pilus assembly protein Flp/PilA